MALCLIFLIFLRTTNLSKHLCSADYKRIKTQMCVLDGFRVTGNCVGDCSPHSGRLPEEDLGTKEEEQGTREGRAYMDILFGTAFDTD